MKKVIPVFFAIDDQYAPCLAVALHSIIENASDKYFYRLIILHQQLSKKNMTRLGRYTCDKARVDFVRMEERFEGISASRMSDNLRPDCFTLTIYYRLFIADMFPEYNRGIYIDSDICVPGDISKLYEKPLGDNLIGACPDFSIFDVPPFVNYTKEAVGVDVHRYINSGVLLLNLKRLREVQLGSRFMQLLNKWHFDSVAPDQDYINALCKDQIYYLGEEWDAMPDENRQPMPNPCLVHYNRFEKPWIKDDVQYEDLFWEYARKTEYYADLTNFKNNYTEAQRQTDRSNLELMIARAVAIAKEPDNMRRVFESGRDYRLQHQVLVEYA